MISKTKLIIFTLIYLLVGTILVYVFYLDEWNKSIFQLSFNFGDVVENIIKNNKFEGKYIYNIPIYFRAHRLPVIPYFISYLSIILGTQKILYVALLKNLIFSILWIPVLHEGINKKNIKPIYKVILAGFILSFPQIFLHGLQIDLEESYVIPILAYYWILINNDRPFTNNQKFAFLILPSLLFFSKNTFLYIVPILSAIILISDKKKIKIVLISLLLLLVSAFGLATFNLKNSGKFTAKYSLEWFNIYKGNNELTSKFYPRLSLDILDHIDFYRIPDSVKTEWQFNEFFKNKTMNYYENHFDSIIKFLPIKIMTIWIDVMPNGFAPFNEHRYFTPTKIIGIIYMILFRAVQWFCLIFLLLKIFGSDREKYFSLSLNYISLIGLYYIPYTIAFGFERHLMPMVIPTVLTFILILEKSRFKLRIK